MSDRNPPSSRREFVQLMVGWSTTLSALLASLAATIRFLVPNVLYEPDRRYKARQPGDYAEGTTFIPEVKVFLLRKGNRYRAVSAVCSHLGCTVNRDAPGPGFMCPCHGSRFDENGTVLDGPAPKPLAWHPVQLSRDGRLVIDTSKQTEPDRSLEV